MMNRMKCQGATCKAGKEVCCAECDGHDTCKDVWKCGREYHSGCELRKS